MILKFDKLSQCYKNKHKYLGYSLDNTQLDNFIAYENKHLTTFISRLYCKFILIRIEYIDEKNIIYITFKNKTFITKIIKYDLYCLKIII